MTDAARELLLFHFCRLQLPAVRMPFGTFQKHLQRTFDLFRGKQAKATRTSYLETLYAVDWFLCCGCIERQQRAWDRLFASRTGRTDCLLIDALRARAVRLYPRDEERQDRQRPLAPWLIRVFQNWHLSQLRSRPDDQALPDEDIALPLPPQSDDR